MREITQLEVTETNERLNGDNADLVMTCAIYTATASKFKSGDKRAATHCQFQNHRTAQLCAENRNRI